MAIQGMGTRADKGPESCPHRFGGHMYSCCNPLLALLKYSLQLYQRDSLNFFKNPESRIPAWALHFKAKIEMDSSKLHCAPNYTF
jgi:hypothetical protein